MITPTKHYSLIEVIKETQTEGGIIVTDLNDKPLTKGKILSSQSKKFPEGTIVLFPSYEGFKMDQQVLLLSERIVATVS